MAAAEEEDLQSTAEAEALHGDEGPVDAVAPHPIEERLVQLADLREQALHAGSAAAVERQHQRGKLTARERIELLLDPGTFVELDMLARHRAHGFGIENTRPLTDGVVTGLGIGRRSQGLRVQPRLHRVRRSARRSVRREDPQGDGPRRIRRRARRRAQRRCRRAHSGGSGLPRRVRRDLLAQREGLRRHPPDQRGARTLRRRRGVLACAHRLRRDGEGHFAHVHHGPRRREDGHRARTSLRNSSAAR